ncbi:ABC transporter permease [Acidiphilium sp. AL]|uniref:ABC transporter permease n=1 Tax=Acidiphilium sp. AL TaxID=2871704 RepID=UPI0021CAF1F7|nr:ABC transporter permease [Acidiphilium sp. AL]MCU4162034.1 ABC transporter permease [Acidiphilium sp. AL]
MEIVVTIAQRVSHALLLILAVIVLNFTLIHLAPGGPAQVMAGEMGGASPQVLAQLRISYGLDHSFLDQLWRYVSHVLEGNLGRSFYYNTPVLQLLLQRLPATLLLMITAIVLAATVGTWLGIIAAQKPAGLLSHAITILSLVGYSAPVFWTGLLLLVLFTSVLPIFPVGGIEHIAHPDLTWFGHILDVARHLVLPAVTLSIVFLAQYSRLSRATMLETLDADYIRTARAKGLPERTVVFKHALRNAILPIVTIIGLQFSQVFAGAILIETVFDWPGLGRLAFDSIIRRDTPTLLGLLLFSAVLVIIANLLTDLAYRRLDPRIRGTSRR